jgi:glycosyltransferase involved in cell wall biosynthesis
MVSEHASPLAVPGAGDGGGQALHVHELSRALARLGHEVSVYTRRDSQGARGRVVTDCGYHVVHVRAGPPEPLSKDDILPYMRDFAQFLYGEWCMNPPDIAHAHFWMSGLAAGLAGKHTRTPVVQTYHALGVVQRRYQRDADTSPAERARIERLVGRQAARVVATCTDEVFELVRMGVARRTISLVPCGVDGEAFTPTGPTANRQAPHRLVAVGRLAPRKGFDAVIEVLPQLPGAELVIAGGEQGASSDADPEAARLAELAENAGVADRVHLLGSVGREDMPAVLRSADAVMCTPAYEPFGVAALEAMACGVPVVASAVGGLTDTVVDRVTGLHVPPGDSGALIGAVRSLLAEPTRRQAMGAAGRDRVTSRYGWDRIAAETLRAYEHALKADSAGEEQRSPHGRGQARPTRVPARERRVSS